MTQKIEWFGAGEYLAVSGHIETERIGEDTVEPGNIAVQIGAGTQSLVVEGTPTQMRAFVRQVDRAVKTATERLRE